MHCSHDFSVFTSVGRIFVSEIVDNSVGNCENKRYAAVGDTTEGLG